jgi:hypothetical protein
MQFSAADTHAQLDSKSKMTDANTFHAKICRAAMMEYLGFTFIENTLMGEEHHVNDRSTRRGETR